jgi:hypothetical protein
MGRLGKRLASIGLAITVASAGGCGCAERATAGDGGARGDGGSVERLVGYCEEMIDSTRTCTPSCGDAMDASHEGACAPEAEAARESPEMQRLRECAGACRLARTCDAGDGGVSRSFFDCTCAGRCLAERTPDFVQRYAELAACERAAVSAACL